jgi:hypothetical protein
MKIYLICCAVMMFVFLFRVYAEAAQYRKEHPGVQFKKSCFSKSMISLLQICCYFLIPLLNLFLFGVALFGSEDIYIKAIEEKVLR